MNVFIVSVPNEEERKRDMRIRNGFEDFFCFKKNSEEREGKGGREPFSLFPLPSSPLDQRPVHGLFFFVL